MLRFKNFTVSDVKTYLLQSDLHKHIYTLFPDGFHGLSFFFSLLQALIYFFCNSGSFNVGKIQVCFLSDHAYGSQIPHYLMPSCLY